MKISKCIIIGERSGCIVFSNGSLQLYSYHSGEVHTTYHAKADYLVDRDDAVEVSLKKFMKKMYGI